MTVVIPEQQAQPINDPRVEWKIKLLPWVFGENKPKHDNWSISREEIARLSDTEYYMLTKGRHLSP